MAVYTVSLFFGSFTNNQVLYTVPAGQVVILRDLELYTSPSAGQDLIGVYLQRPGTGAAILVLREATNTAPTIQWTGRVAMNAGDELIGSTVNTPAHCLATGYIFPANPTFQ